MKRKKILFIHERYGRYSGAEQHIFVIAPQLATSYDLAFLYEQTTGKDEDLFDSFFTEKVHWQNKENRAEIEILLREIGPDLIYINKCLSVPMLQAIIRSGVPAVRMVHDHEVYCMRAYKYFPWSRRICHKKAGPCCLFPCLASVQRDRSRGPLGVRWVSYQQKQDLIHFDQKLAAFFVVTQYMFDELVLQGYDSKRISIFPPVPIPIEHVKESSFSPENIILFVGQIVRGKGLDCLLKALAHVKSSFKLIVCGEGSHEQYCRKLATQLGLTDRVDFCGLVRHELLPDYYAQASLAVIPSVWPEPIATIGLEIMRYGLPIVAFDSGGITDWLQDSYNGYLIPWMDIQAMAAKIDYLIQHKEIAKQMGRNGQRIMAEQYDFNRYITHLKGAFAALIRS